jgi:hypothetical protein
MARESRVVAARFGPAYRRITEALDNLDWLPNFVLRVTVGFMFFSGAPQHAFGGGHRDDGHLGEVFDIGAQRHTVLRYPRSEDDKGVFSTSSKNALRTARNDPFGRP